MSDLRVVDLRSELTVELLGTEVERPRLSWRIESDARGVAQASYRIRAATTAERLASDDGLLFDSGETVDAAQGDIPYPGPGLAAMQRIWWNVTVTDDRGVSAQSLPTWFETGLSRDDWRADWIEAEDDAAAADRAAGLAWVWSETPLDPRPHAFRLDFDAPADIVRADIPDRGQGSSPRRLGERRAFGPALGLRLGLAVAVLGNARRVCRRGASRPQQYLRAGRGGYDGILPGRWRCVRRADPIAPCGRIDRSHRQRAGLARRRRCAVWLACSGLRRERVACRGTKPGQRR